MEGASAEGRVGGGGAAGGGGGGGSGVGGRRAPRWALPRVAAGVWSTEGRAVAAGGAGGGGRVLVGTRRSAASETTWLGLGLGC